MKWTDVVKYARLSRAGLPDLSCGGGLWGISTSTDWSCQHVGLPRKAFGTRGYMCHWRPPSPKARYCLNFGSQILHQWVLDSQSLRKHTRLFIIKMGNGQRSKRGMQCRRPWLLKHSRGVFGESIADCRGALGGFEQSWAGTKGGPISTQALSRSRLERAPPLALLSVDTHCHPPWVLSSSAGKDDLTSLVTLAEIRSQPSPSRD